MQKIKKNALLMQKMKNICIPNAKNKKELHSQVLKFEI
jgi:hypothetical protein